MPIIDEDKDETEGDGDEDEQKRRREEQLRSMRSMPNIEVRLRNIGMPMSYSACQERHSRDEISFLFTRLAFLRDEMR